MFSNWVAALLQPVSAKLDKIQQEQLKIMAAIDDLQTSITNLGTSISSELAAISAKLSAIPPTGGTSDAQIEAVVTQVNALKTQVDTETASLTPAPIPRLRLRPLRPPDGPTAR